MTTHADPDATERREEDAAMRAAARGIALWGAGVALASATRTFDRVAPVTIGPLILAGIAIPSIAYARSEPLRRVAARTGAHRVTLIHIWRIAAGIAFLRWGAYGTLPKTFTDRAGWGDIASGILALGLAAAPENAKAVRAVNVFGALDLAVAIGTGVSLVLRKEPAMRRVARFPQALIPLFGVGLTGAAHVIAFDLLHRDRRAEEPLAPRPTP